MVGLRGWLPYIQSTHSQPLPSTQQNRAWSKPAINGEFVKSSSDLKSSEFQNLRMILGFCYTCTRELARSSINHNLQWEYIEHLQPHWPSALRY